MDHTPVNQTYRDQLKQQLRMTWRVDITSAVIDLTGDEEIIDLTQV